MTDGVPEADLAEQRITADATDDEQLLDLDRLANADDAEANLADLIDQAISVPLPTDDYDSAR